MNIEEIYKLRKGYTVIAITGRTGSGCTKIANRIKLGFTNDTEIFQHPNQKELNHNAYRKYRIVYEYCKENFKEHIMISYKDILTLFILKHDFATFIAFLQDDSKLIKKNFEKSKLEHLAGFDLEIKRLNKIKIQHNILHQKTLKALERKDQTRTLIGELELLVKLFNSFEFMNFSNRLHNELEHYSKVKRNKLLQIIADNIRKSGLYNSDNKNELENLFIICKLINDIIKGFSRRAKKKNVPTKIVIDSLRNPLEIMFFRQRFSAFYTIAINRDEDSRNNNLKKIFKKDTNDDILTLLKEEYHGEKIDKIYKQDVSQCIQNADIHIAFKDKKEVDSLNKLIKTKNENISPYFSWEMQLLKFISLIEHPGIITPSPEERCMQLAFTAKYNSGCISRQVGAAITDSNYSIKAIGWNNTPEGQIPCNLRNANDLLENNGDLQAFTPYEKNNGDFKKAFEKHFKQQIIDNSEDLKGRSVCFCFKSLKNSYSEGKNQVHTRSLHAEESAFLQITKYGGQGIQYGKLFTTASPCELCSKKAYQLGIKVIYYIDPYPGISLEQILSAGPLDRNPELRLFHGAIGNAYLWLYEPFMAYKDELALILTQDIQDFASNKGNEIISKDNEIKILKEEIEKLKKGKK